MKWVNIIDVLLTLDQWECSVVIAIQF